MEWIFIAGCNRNGTTLIRRLVSAFKKIDCLPQEGHGIPSIRRRKWIPYGGDEGYGGFWSLNKKFHMTEYTDYDYGNLFRVWKSARCKQGNQEFIVEKDPENCIRTRWLQKVTLESENSYPYFVGIVRNPYAAIPSIVDDTEANFETAAIHWNNSYKLLKDDSGKLQNFIMFKYEDLVDDVDAFFQTFSSFMNIENEIESPKSRGWPDNRLDACKTWKEYINFDANNKRISNLTNEQIGIINEHTKDMREYHEYPKIQE